MQKTIACYMRVSTGGQNLASQKLDLEHWAAWQELQTVWYEDHASGKTMDRPGWNKLMEDMKAGKVGKLVCWKLDRLGRTARELLQLFHQLQQLRVDLVCVAGGVNGLDSPEGRLTAGLLAQFAEFDNECRAERIIAGQKAAKARGVTWGGSQPGKRKKVRPEHERAIQKLKAAGETISAIARTVGLNRKTVRSVLQGPAYV